MNLKKMLIKKLFLFIVIIVLASCGKKIKNQQQIKWDQFEQDETDNFNNMKKKYAQEIDLVKLYKDNKIESEEFFKQMKSIVYSRFDHEENDKPFSMYRYQLENDINYVAYIAYKEALGSRPIKKRAVKFLDDLNLLDENLFLVPELTFERRCR